MPLQFPLPTTSSPPPTRASNPPSLGWMLLLTAALFALVLPIIGPLDDHHFAERTHTHAHIYLNGRPVQHGHAYENGQRHLHRPATRGAGAQRADGILYLTPATAGLMLAVMSAPCHTAPDAMRPPTPRAKNTNLLTGFAAPPGEPNATDIPPPLPPPVA